ncbi:MAG: hypothetical protein V1874_12565 [Spirochaetota bacterium]
MNDNLNIFEQALVKLKFREPVSAEARRFALYNKQKVLEATLRSFGDYSFFYGLTLRIYFYTKRRGISLSVLQSKIVLITLAAIAGGALYSAAMFASGIMQRDASVANRHSVIPAYHKTDQIQQEPAIKYPAKKEINSNVKYRIGIERFSGAVDDTVLNNMTDKFTGELTGLKSADKIINLSKGKQTKNINILLTGTVEKLGSAYIISVKIINVENSVVLFVFTEELKNIDNFNSAISNIAQKTAQEFK